MISLLVVFAPRAVRLAGSRWTNQPNHARGRAPIHDLLAAAPLASVAYAALRLGRILRTRRGGTHQTRWHSGGARVGDDLLLLGSALARTNPAYERALAASTRLLPACGRRPVAYQLPPPRASSLRRWAALAHLPSPGSSPPLTHRHGVQRRPTTLMRRTAKSKPAVLSPAPAVAILADPSARRCPIFSGSGRGRTACQETRRYVGRAMSSRSACRQFVVVRGDARVRSFLRLAWPRIAHCRRLGTSSGSRCLDRALHAPKDAVTGRPAGLPCSIAERACSAISHAS